MPRTRTMRRTRPLVSEAPDDSTIQLGRGRATERRLRRMQAMSSPVGGPTTCVIAARCTQRIKVETDSSAYRFINSAAASRPYTHIDGCHAQCQPGDSVWGRRHTACRPIRLLTSLDAASTCDSRDGGVGPGTRFDACQCCPARLGTALSVRLPRRRDTIPRPHPTTGGAR